MGKDMIIKLLEVQLKASNATIDQLNLTIDNMSASMNAMAVTISELRETIANLESLLTERDKSLDKANNQVRGMSKLLEKKSEKQSPVCRTFNLEIPEQYKTHI